MYETMSAEDHFAAQLGTSRSGRLRFMNGAHRVAIRADLRVRSLYRARFGDRMPMVGVRGGVVTFLRRHCEAEGRDYDLIEKTCAFAFDVGERSEKVGEVIGGLRWLAGMGVETVIGFVPNVNRITPLEVIGREFIPAVADF